MQTNSLSSTVQLQSTQARGVRHDWASRVILVAASIVLGALSAYLLTSRDFSFDLGITHAIQAIGIPWFERLMRAVSYPGYPPQLYVFLAFIPAILWIAGLKWEAVTEVFAIVGIGAVGMMVKLLVDRPRPTADIVNVWTVLDGGRLSFPAGHASSYVAILGFLLFVLWQSRQRTWWHIALNAVFSILIVLVGASRVYSGEHWFTDVIGGYSLGLIWLIVTIYVYQWGKSRFFVDKGTASHDPERQQI